MGIDQDGAAYGSDSDQSPDIAHNEPSPSLGGDVANELDGKVKGSAIQAGTVSGGIHQSFNIVSRLSVDDLASLASTGVPPTSAPGKSDSRTVAPRVAAYSGVNPQKLARIMADAQAVTILGLDEWVPDCVEEAIHLKRQEMGPTAFWNYLHVVFCTDELLPYVRDEISIEFPDRVEALRRRVQRNAQIKRRLMSLLLRTGVPGRWTLYSYPYLPPFVGSLFVMPNGRKIVQLAVKRPSGADGDCVYVDFLDGVDHYFEPVFREIIESSSEEQEVVVVGAPKSAGKEFIYRSARFRRSVLVEGRNAEDWLAAIVAITWRKTVEGGEPLLQLNTPNTSTREMGKASHPSGYINQKDCFPVARPNRVPEIAGEFELPLESAYAALQRELREDFGIVDVPSAPQFNGTIPFFYADKENLFFYLFEQEFATLQKFSTVKQMFPWTVSELISLRKHQVLGNALNIVTGSMSLEQADRACRLLTLNLTVHGEFYLGEEVNRAMKIGQVSADLKRRITEQYEATKIFKYSMGREIYVEGIAGLQYRAFFSHLLPAYARIGVPGAADAISSIEDDRRRSDAASTLQALYINEQFMVSLPIEV